MFSGQYSLSLPLSLAVVMAGWQFYKAFILYSLPSAFLPPKNNFRTEIPHSFSQSENRAFYLRFAILFNLILIDMRSDKNNNHISHFSTEYLKSSHVFWLKYFFNTLTKCIIFLALFPHFRRKKKNDKNKM